jgi:hypothetical protein
MTLIAAAAVFTRRDLVGGGARPNSADLVLARGTAAIVGRPRR